MNSGDQSCDPRFPHSGLLSATALKAWQQTGAPASDMLVAHVAYRSAPRRIGSFPAESLLPVLIVSRVKSRELTLKALKATTW